MFINTQVEASNQMCKAVLEQVSKFLEKAHTSLNANIDRPNLPIKNRYEPKKNIYVVNTSFDHF